MFNFTAKLIVLSILFNLCKVLSEQIDSKSELATTVTSDAGFGEWARELFFFDNFLTVNIYKQINLSF